MSCARVWLELHVDASAFRHRLVDCCDDPIGTAQSIMKHHYVRQIPVVGDDGRLLGIVSLGDVNSYLVQAAATEINYLHEYIEGRVR